jgi:hypothetical protein
MVGTMPHARDTTARIAKELWRPESFDLSPGEFQSRFDAVYAIAEGPATWWYLGGAANDYLRHQPQSIVVPAELPQLLLGSAIVDGRIVGLKLLTRLSSDRDEIIVAICNALDSQNESEVLGGLHELGNFLERMGPTTPIPTMELLPRLRKVHLSSPEWLATRSQQLSRWLAELSLHFPVV